MTYTDLFDEIKLLTNRGDIDLKIAVALRLTTLRVHNAEFWWRDLVEADAAFASSNVVAINTNALTRFRQVCYIQYKDLATGMVGKLLDEIDPTAIFDNDNYMRTDVWYMAGTVINANFEFPTSGARIGYWQNPDVTPGGYNSWIKDQLPDILVQGSLAYLYNTLGKQEEARSINQMCGLEVDPKNRYPGLTLMDQLRATNLRASGHAN